MSASARMAKWKRILTKAAPWLFTICPGGNWHWRWQRLCYCKWGDGGIRILDLKLKRCYVPDQITVRIPVEDLLADDSRQLAYKWIRMGYHMDPPNPIKGILRRANIDLDGPIERWEDEDHPAYVFKGYRKYPERE